MNGLTHALPMPGFRTKVLGKLRRAREREAHLLSALAEATEHCRLCGEHYRAQGNHLCPNLYGR